jgi:hypothetical protein
VCGKEIDHWYNEENYLYRSGSLGNSCMANKKGYFDIYTDNPDSCKLVILKVGDKIAARALLWRIWKISSKDEKTNGKINSEWFLDRVYSVEDYQINKIRKWASEKGYALRKYNSGYDTSSIFYKNVSYRNTEISIKVKPKEYIKYPYLDTFTRYDSKSGILYNDDYIRKGGHILRSTQGDYTPSVPRRQVIVNRFRDFLNI